MKNNIKVQNDFISDEYSIFIRKKRAYFTTKNSIEPISGVRLTHNKNGSKKVYNEVIIRAKTPGWTGTYQQGTEKIISLTDVISGTSYVKNVDYAQDKIEYFPWIGPTKALFRLKTVKTDGQSPSLKVYLISVDKIGYLNPAEQIIFTFHHASVNNSSRWILDSIEFENKLDKNGNSLISTKNVKIISKNGSTLDSGTKNGNMSSFFPRETDLEKLALIVTGDNYTGTLVQINNRNNDPTGEFYAIAFEKINELTHLFGQVYNYDNPNDSNDLNRLLTLDWCRIYESSTTITDANFERYVQNVFFTSPATTGNNISYNYSDFYTQKINLLRNGDSNTDPEYLKYLINSIIGYSDDIDTYKFTSGNIHNELECKWCSNETDTYIRKQSDGIFNSERWGSLGSTSIKTDDYVRFEDFFMDQENSKILKSTIEIYKQDSKTYLIKNYIEVFE